MANMEKRLRADMANMEKRLRADMSKIGKSLRTDMAQVDAVQRADAAAINMRLDTLTQTIITSAIARGPQSDLPAERPVQAVPVSTVPDS